MWQEQVQIGIYLGHLMQHAQSITLILCLSTGNVSLQYHCYMGDTFDTVVGAEACPIPKLQQQGKNKLRGEILEEHKKEARLQHHFLLHRQ